MRWPLGAKVVRPAAVAVPVRLLSVCALLLALLPLPANAEPVIDASAPSDIAVTVYRDPDRAGDAHIDRNWPKGFAMISETRSVTLPPGRSTIRFTGVAEGMVAVSAIVTGLPGGVIEKSRNATLLSPAALVDGTLGNRVRITRTNPGTGAETSEDAIIRTRADGGLILQTHEGFEAVRCSGLLERLSFDHLPDGLSAKPVFTLDTGDEQGGTYTIVLTYLAWGFDWQANYVATLHPGGSGKQVGLDLVSWLTVFNDNGQNFPNAHLMAVAGRLSVVSDFAALADPPAGEPLRLTCYPLGSSLKARSRARDLAPPPLPPPAPMASPAAEIAVTGQRRVAAKEENLGDLKLYRLEERVDVAARGMKQVVFLDREHVSGQFVYLADCSPGGQASTTRRAGILFESRNDAAHGLGLALPTGPISWFEPSPAGDQLVGERVLRDYAEGQDLNLPVALSNQVTTDCSITARQGGTDAWQDMRLEVSNANPEPVTLHVMLGTAGTWTYRGIATQIKYGRRIAVLTVPANTRRAWTWSTRQAAQ